MVAHARMFDDDDDDDYSGGVAVAEEEEERPDPNNEYVRQYPNRLFVEETLKEFPEAGVADVEQARVGFT